MRSSGPLPPWGASLPPSGGGAPPRADAEGDWKRGVPGSTCTDAARAAHTRAAQRPPARAATSPQTIAEALPIFLRHASPCLLLGVVLLAAAVRLRWGHWSTWDLVPIGATLVLWPVQEWLIHVFILHFKPTTLWGWQIDFHVPRKHRAHHRDPWNYAILFIPLRSYSYSLPLVLALWRAVTPTTALALTGFTAHMVLALHYEWIHFLVHTRVTPRTRYYQRIWKNHRLHHFKNEHYWYGVTRLEADWLLATAPPADAVPPSPTARTLLITTPLAAE
jgi:hypothetical protein